MSKRSKVAMDVKRIPQFREKQAVVARKIIGLKNSDLGFGVKIFRKKYSGGY
jgi:hypothetical protein